MGDLKAIRTAIRGEQVVGKMVGKQALIDWLEVMNGDGDQDDSSFNKDLAVSRSAVFNPSVNQP